MSKTIEEIRAIVATEQGYDSWEDFLEWDDTDDVAYHLAIEYSNQQTQELKEQNTELVDMLQRFIDNNMMSVTADYEAKEILAKYNHLKSNTNETDKI